MKKALVLTVALATGAVFASASQVHLVILHTTDIHGYTRPYNYRTARPRRGSLAQVATYVKQVKGREENVLVLDSGDTIQGTPLEEFELVKWGKESPAIAAMNAIGYDAMAVGNHEFNFGMPILEKARDQASFPFLSANILDASGRPHFVPMIIKRFGNLKVGIIGITTPDIPRWEVPQHWKGLSFQPMVESANKWVAEAKSSGCQLVILLAHTGWEEDPESTENFGKRLAEQVDGADVLLLGHTHKLMKPWRLPGGPIVAQPGARATHVARIDLFLSKEASKWRIASWHGKLVDVRSTKPDDEILSLTEKAHQEVERQLSKIICTVTSPVSVKGCRVKDCAPLDLIHKVQLEASGADISVAALLTDATPDLAPGPVPLRWVYSLYVFPNTLIAVKMTREQLKAYLEHAARYYDGISCQVHEGTCAVLADATIRRYNVDTAEGASYFIDPLLPEGNRVWMLKAPEPEMVVVMNSYRAQGGGGYPLPRPLPVVWKGSEDVASLIARYLEKLGVWEPEASGNWAIAPSRLSEHLEKDKAAR